MINKLCIWFALLPALIAFNSFGQSLTQDPSTQITDLYAFRSPDDTNTITIIANYVPQHGPKVGMSNGTFGENVRYEIHIENDGTAGDDITYRFTFSQVNQDPTTIFGIRLGQQNYKTTYILEKSVNSGTFNTIVSNGIVPPENIGNRSILDPTVGLGAASYNSLVISSINNASGAGGETVFCGPADDPFFTNIGGFNDVANASPSNINTLNSGMNIHSIALKIPIATLQKNGLPVSSAVNILDSDFIIGVWASASRPAIRTLNANGTETYSGSWIQVSRMGMPLTDEMIIPIGQIDSWNSKTPYTEDPAMEDYFCNPEMGLYMDNSLFGGAIPALFPLRIQRNSLQAFDFGNTQDGLWPIKATNGGAGTALDTNLFGSYLLRQGNPRSVDILPLYYTGIPNLAPYQLAIGKAGNPLATGKPIINNFLPSFGDMLRLNMAVPVTPRNSASFSSLGLVNAALLGLTDTSYNANASLQEIPNMDGFPNGRRLEDDVTRISLQMNSGILLAAMGFGYDDYIAGGPNLVTSSFMNVINYSTGVESNDTSFKASFPYVQIPWMSTSSDYHIVTLHVTVYDTTYISVTDTLIIDVALSVPPPSNVNRIKVFPNPASDHITINTGDFALMVGYTIEITNTFSQIVFTTPINQQSYYIDLSSWTGYGTYFVNIKDPSNNTIETKKIILQ